MNAVGIDVSKYKSTVAILRPFGEIVANSFDVKHTSTGINFFIAQLNTLDNDTRIVMDHTGRYYEPMAQWLSDAEFFVTAVNPKLIKDFGKNSLRKVKTDKADAVKIARYTLDNWCDLQQYSSMDELRNQLKNMKAGVGTTLGPQLIAEIGDVTRFSHKGALAAYAGVDPGLTNLGPMNSKV